MNNYCYPSPIFYWDSIASSTLFTHPLNKKWMDEYVDKKGSIIDYGCGYGRIVSELKGIGYENVIGYDTSVNLINRGKADTQLNLQYIESANEIKCIDSSADCIILFAVLTCIPLNQDQSKLIQILKSKLQPGGTIYISDYYLQGSSNEVRKYEYLNNDENNYGIFTIDESTIFRHHTRDWIKFLFKDFYVIQESELEVSTLKGNKANAFQIILRK